jgi:hypothetical protein
LPVVVSLLYSFKASPHGGHGLDEHHLFAFFKHGSSLVIVGLFDGAPTLTSGLLATLDLFALSLTALSIC